MSFSHSSPKSQKRKRRRTSFPKTDGLIADEELRESRRNSSLDQRSSCHQFRSESGFGQKTTQQVDRRLRGRVDFDLVDLGKFSGVGEEDAVDRPMRRDTNAIDQDIDRIPKKFEARDERDLQRALGKLLAELARMIEHDLARPSVNQRASVEILNATDTRHFRRLDGFSPYHIMRKRVRLRPRSAPLAARDACGIDAAIMAVPLHRFTPGFADGTFERRRRFAAAEWWRQPCGKSFPPEWCRANRPRHS